MLLGSGEPLELRAFRAARVMASRRAMPSLRRRPSRWRPVVLRWCRRLPAVATRRFTGSMAPITVNVHFHAGSSDLRVRDPLYGARTLAIASARAGGRGSKSALLVNAQPSTRFLPTAPHALDRPRGAAFVTATRSWRRVRDMQDPTNGFRLQGRTVSDTSASAWLRRSNRRAIPATPAVPARTALRTRRSARAMAIDAAVPLVTPARLVPPRVTPFTVIDAVRQGRPRARGDVSHVLARRIVTMEHALNLVWRTASAAHAAPAAAAMATAPGRDAIPSNRARDADAPAPSVTSEALRTEKPAIQGVALDPAVVERLADDVIRRVERRIRIERERRGI